MPWLSGRIASSAERAQMPLSSGPTALRNEARAQMLLLSGPTALRSAARAQMLSLNGPTASSEARAQMPLSSGLTALRSAARVQMPSLSGLTALRSAARAQMLLSSGPTASKRRPCRLCSNKTLLPAPIQKGKSTLLLFLGSLGQSLSKIRFGGDWLWTVNFFCSCFWLDIVSRMPKCLSSNVSCCLFGKGYVYDIQTWPSFISIVLLESWWRGKERWLCPSFFVH
ncbi:hypothetical protein BX600DRAFT_543511 [Xylariales sp. PMI_506]|nr:hypothetical protein BX600DRAFT_543511 [Xylariales sp. PMI_506]